MNRQNATTNPRQFQIKFKKEFKTKLKYPNPALQFYHPEKQAQLMLGGNPLRAIKRTRETIKERKEIQSVK